MIIRFFTKARACLMPISAAVRTPANRRPRREGNVGQSGNPSTRFLQTFGCRSRISRAVVFSHAMVLAVLATATLPERANAQAAFATSKNICTGVPDPINNNPNTCPFTPIVGVGQQVFYVIKVTNPPGSPQQNITLTEHYPAGFVPGAIVCTDQTGAPPLFLNVANPVIDFQLQFDSTVTCTIAGSFNSTASGLLQTNVVDVDNHQSPVQSPSVQTTVAQTTQLTTDLQLTKTESPSPIGVGTAYPLPATVTYTATIKNNGPSAVDVGHWFVLHDTLALLPGSVPLYATVVAGSFTCTATVTAPTTHCLDTAAMNSASWTQQLIGTMAPHPMFDWSFPPSPTPGFTGHIEAGATITLTWQVKIEKLPTLSCVISLTSNGLKNQAFFTLTNPDGTAANDINNANNTASAPVSVNLTGTVDPNCGAGQLTMTKTQVSPANPVTWGGPTWPPTAGTVTYDITIKNTSMPQQTITIPGNQFEDFVINGTGTPPFTRTFVSAICVTSNPATICTGFNSAGGGGNPPPPPPFPSILTQFPYTFYGQQNLGWRSKTTWPLVLAYGESVKIRIRFNYFGPDCETVPNVTPKLIGNKAQVTYMATAVGAISGSPQNVQYTQFAIVHTQMKSQQPCKFVVKKSFHAGSPTTVQFGTPVVYDVAFINNDVSRTIGTVMDSVRLTDPAYATQVPFTSSWVCTQTGGVTPLPSPAPPLNGTAIYTGSPAQGSPVFQFTNLHFNNGAQLKCTVTITVNRPLPNNPHCSMNLVHWENAALMDVTHPFNTNVPWPPSGVYGSGGSNPTPQNKNWATLKSPLPKCYNFNVHKAASVSGVTTNAWTSPSGPPVKYAIQVTNTGTGGTPLTGGFPPLPSPGWNGLRVADTVTPPYNNRLITIGAPGCVPGTWCTLLKPPAPPPTSPSYAGLLNLAPSASGVWNLTLNPSPPFIAGTYINNCAAVKPTGTFTGPRYYSNYDPANPPPSPCVQVPVLTTTTLSATKVIRNGTGHTVSIPPTASGVNVACQPYPLLSSGNLTLSVGGSLALPNGGSLSSPPGLVSNVPVAAGETCTVTEPTPPAVPLGACAPGTVAYWDTTILPAQPMPVTAGPITVTVTNTLKCKVGYLAIYKIYDDRTGGTPVPPAYTSGFPIQLSCSNFSGTIAVPIKAGFYSSNDPVLTTTGDPTHSMTVGPSTTPTAAGTTCLVTEAPLPPIPSVHACHGGSASWVTTYAPPGGTATILLNQTSNVTVTNSLRCDAAPVCSITITKQTTPAGGTGFNFTSAWSGLQGITLNAGQSTTRPVPCGPIFNVLETPKPGWTLANIACSVSGGTGTFMIIGANANPAFQPGDNEVNFHSLTPGANLQCTFTNDQPGCDLEARTTLSPNPLVSGQQATVTMTVTNVGPAACAPGPFPGTVVRNPAAAGLTFTRPPPGGSGWGCGLGLPDRDASCGNQGTLPVGSSDTFTILGDVTAAPGSQVTNCASVSNQNDTNPANNTSCVTIPVR